MVRSVRAKEGGKINGRGGGILHSSWEGVNPGGGKEGIKRLLIDSEFIKRYITVLGFFNSKF